MAQLTKDLTERLNQISQKLDSISDNFNNLIESIDKMSSNIGSMMEELSKKIMDYSNLVTSKGQEDFDESRNQLILINDEINKLRKGVGTEQLLKMNNALQGILDIIGGAELNSKDLKQKLAEISKFIESNKG
ncbi:MAG: hypothetical protein ACTSO9_02910 [Candidatus Helarchaeota archaeon]